MKVSDVSITNIFNFSSKPNETLTKTFHALIKETQKLAKNLFSRTEIANEEQEGIVYQGQVTQPNQTTNPDLSKVITKAGNTASTTLGTTKTDTANKMPINLEVQRLKLSDQAKLQLKTENWRRILKNIIELQVKFSFNILD